MISSFQLKIKSYNETGSSSKPSTDDENLEKEKKKKKKRKEKLESKLPCCEINSVLFHNIRPTMP